MYNSFLFQGTNAEFLYGIIDPQQAFSIDETTGVVQVQDQALLDREKQEIWTFFVSYLFVFYLTILIYIYKDFIYI